MIKSLSREKKRKSGNERNVNKIYKNKVSQPNLNKIWRSTLGSKTISGTWKLFEKMMLFISY